MTAKINFTKRALEAIEPVPGRQIYVYDSRVNGLALRVSPTGVRTFVLYRKINGIPERVTLGRFPDLTIEQARGRANQGNSTIAQGESPNESKRALREQLTLGGLFDLFLERHAKLHKRSWPQDEAKFNRYLSHWKSRKLSAIRKADIQALHAKLGQEAGIYAANRTLELLKTLFNKAADWGYEQPNPAQGVKKFREQSRDRFLEADELPRFFQALAEEPNELIRDYFLLSLLTGARRANVQAMRWEEISVERGVWTIPTTKNGDPHKVPLLAEALAVLAARRAVSDSPFVFPGTGTTGHLVEPKTAWKRILARAGIENLRIHDLRRTLGSWQAATGASLSIIGKTLAHKNVSTTAIYARLNLDPVRAALETATRAMFEAGKVGDRATVIPLPKTRSGRE